MSKNQTTERDTEELMARRELQYKLTQISHNLLADTLYNREDAAKELIEIAEDI